MGEVEATQVGPATRPPWWRLGRLVIPAVVVIAAAALTVWLLNRDSGQLGPSDGPAARVHAALAQSMTCTTGQLTDERTLLACYRQDDDVEVVFLQAAPSGEVASYTVETIHTDSADPHDHSTEVDEHNVDLAGRVAAAIEPGTSFDQCRHDLTSPYYCFGSLAAWHSNTLEPVTTTGTAAQVPSPEAISEALRGQLGWDCGYGLCSYDGGSMSVHTQATSTGLQYAGPVRAEDVAASARVVVGLLPDSPALQKWVTAYGGGLAIVIADGHVVGYLPQGGGGGVFVIGEVAGVLPGEA